MSESINKIVMFFKDISYHYKVNQNKEITMIQICESNNYIQTLMEKKDKKIASERMKQFKEDVMHWKEYDFAVINDKIEKCYRQIISYIKKKQKNKKVLNYNKKIINYHINKLIN